MRVPLFSGAGRICTWVRRFVLLFQSKFKPISPPTYSALSTAVKQRFSIELRPDPAWRRRHLTIRTLVKNTTVDCVTPSRWLPSTQHHTTKTDAVDDDGQSLATTTTAITTHRSRPTLVTRNVRPRPGTCPVK